MTDIRRPICHCIPGGGEGGATKIFWEMDTERSQWIRKPASDRTDADSAGDT